MGMALHKILTIVSQSNSAVVNDLQMLVKQLCLGQIRTEPSLRSII
jgi:hypothetical protein